MQHRYQNREYQPYRKLFDNSGIENVNGHRVLGSVMGSESACSDYKLKKQNEYIGVVGKLSNAETSPQNVSLFQQGTSERVSFLIPHCTSNFHETGKHWEPNDTGFDRQVTNFDRQTNAP